MVSPVSGKTIGKVVEAQVHGKKVILISTSLFAIVFDGHNIWVETSQLYKGKKILIVQILYVNEKLKFWLKSWIVEYFLPMKNNFCVKISRITISRWKRKLNSRLENLIFLSFHSHSKKDNKIQIIFPTIIVIFIIYILNFFLGKLSGVCGNANQQIRDELVGPDQCIHSTPEILSAAYR